MKKMSNLDNFPYIFLTSNDRESSFEGIFVSIENLINFTLKFLLSGIAAFCIRILMFE